MKVRRKVVISFGRLLAPVLLALCTPCPANEPLKAPKSPAILAADKYIDCTVGFVREYAASANSATEVAEGALGKCSSYLIAYQDAERDYFLRSDPLEADKRAREMKEQLESTARMKLIAYALQIRVES
jgi:hypothetical protein